MPNQLLCPKCFEVWTKNHKCEPGKCQYCGKERTANDGHVCERFTVADLFVPSEEIADKYALGLIGRCNG